jgi:arginine-tRNA-protein transferase
MAYKTSFKPLERLGRDGWKRFDPAEQESKSASGPFALPGRHDRKQFLIDA